MKTLENVESAIYQIKNTIIGNSDIRKLLYINTPSALTSSTNVTVANVENLISIRPYIQDDDGIENSSQSNFMIIYPTYMDFSNDIQHTIQISIDIFVYKDNYFLDGAKTRILQLLNKVIDVLNDKKLSFAERFQINDARLTNIDQGKTIGYLTTWSIVNGTATNY
jgi:hypothetical protein